ncbi:hypothetical protein BCPG3_078 [Bacillus phage BCPG3]|uniref:Uncharacterized protein n=2 Tax=Wphvirus TaxID=1922327 RepID=W5QUU0_9CAUD|nr:hypothetical protein BPS13_0071 [Bacillus phage BPS13]YP_009002956.1 hypothetical protein BPS10C_070 [Bacillus phage BPS10C]QSJ04395.1 hypothetical protein BCPG3_078 [Bacillus phage BCPG3]QSJ04607.1 hypothetical protein BCP18_075 [Bacillus phage BCP18]AEZ50250.1 hypothetical protein BPS13_0071 [Bacillus phage BPS13]AGI12067.1 hypothetical protein BPS10C_070 [Bacillus phage BPS10C]
MIRVLVQDIREGIKEKKTFNDEGELELYLKRNPFVIVKDKAQLRKIYTTTRNTYYTADEEPFQESYE